MKRNILFLSTFSLFLSILPGCGRIIDWGKDNFYQGAEVGQDLSIARNYIQSRRVYDQFTLVGAFDALWLSDDVRKVHTNIYARKYGKNEEQKRVFLRRQLEENSHFITFYVLSPKNILLGDKDSYWSMLLKLMISSLHLLSKKWLIFLRNIVIFLAKNITNLKMFILSTLMPKTLRISS